MVRAPSPLLGGYRPEKPTTTEMALNSKFSMFLLTLAHLLGEENALALAPGVRLDNEDGLACPLRAELRPGSTRPEDWAGPTDRATHRRGEGEEEKAFRRVGRKRERERERWWFGLRYRGTKSVLGRLLETQTRQYEGGTIRKVAMQT